MIASLQSLRFLFAIMIFLHHFPYNGEGLFAAGGTCGVAFFMMLSGFVMSAGYSAKAKEATFEFGNFLKKRLIKLYPLHLFCLLVFVVLHICSLNWKGYIAIVPNVLLLQSWIPLRRIYFSGNAVSWCLADMVFFYCMFPFIIKFIDSANRKIIVILSIIVISAYILALFYIPDTYIHQLLIPISS